jgi:triosephosphate isomerase
VAQRQDPRNKHEKQRMRRPIVAGNWKMNLTIQEGQDLVGKLKASCDKMTAVEIVVCPVYTALSAISPLLSDSSIGLGAQDMFWEPQGAFTGEVSPIMLRDAGCRYVIIGHSERRRHFGETDETVKRKLASALKHQLRPVVCIGETLQERQAGQTLKVLERQLSGALVGFTSADAEKIVLAYEPVWAIGTGQNATPDQAQESHAFIRKWLVSHWGVETAARVRVQYGGSVTAENAAALMSQPDVDGALVGGASLKAEGFAAIVRAALEAKTVAA